MTQVPSGKKAVDAAVSALAERIADGDPTDSALRAECDAALELLRAAYRRDKAAFSKEAVETLQELGALLREAAAT